jgi:hypothetical protein
MLFGVAVFLQSDRERLRTLQQASELTSVQKTLSVPRVSWGSFSETRQVFDLELLKPILERGQRRLPEGRDQLARRSRQDPRADLRTPLADRGLFPRAQASAGLPASAEPSPGRDQDSNVLRDHRLLINLWAGCQPTKRTHKILCDSLMGWANEDEPLAHLAKLITRDVTGTR